MSTTAYSHQLSGGGLGLLRVIALSLGIIAAGAFVPAQATEENVPQRAGTKDELVTLVRTAIEKENFSMIDNIVNWQGVSNYKRRVFSSQILHALGRPISKIEVEDADQDPHKPFENEKSHAKYGCDASPARDILRRRAGRHRTGRSVFDRTNGG